MELAVIVCKDAAMVVPRMWQIKEEGEKKK